MSVFEPLNRWRPSKALLSVVLACSVSWSTSSLIDWRPAGVVEPLAACSVSSRTRWAMSLSEPRAVSVASSQLRDSSTAVR